MNSRNRATILKIIKKEMPYLREYFGVEKMALFGSFARDEGTDESDIDIVVSLSKPLGFTFFKLIDYLEEKLSSNVDIITTTTLEFGLPDHRRAHISRDIQESLIYVKNKARWRLFTGY